MTWSKRLVDLAVVIVFAPLWIPVMLLVGLAVRTNLGSPVLFRQARAGLKGNSFLMIKFRSMNDQRDAGGNLLPDSQRLTRFGRFLRASSLDELPELWNVIKGEMSLVGPRPLLVDYLPLYTETEARRHEVCPGITGWVQVNGRNELSWEDKFRLDVWYVDNRSVWLDIRILFLTIWRVVNRDGISPKDQTTMPRFSGSKDQD
jgi:lipopolysaccharide/colanic/teichoic acid biosynthesis glycosyltransferase